MSYDADMKMVRDRFNKWGETAIIGKDEFAAADSLIQRHYDDRGRVFEDLVNALKRDSDIQSPWDSLCDKGLDLNERLNSAISSKVNDGFRGMKMGDFYDGEKIAWQVCKSGRIGLVCEAMIEIMKNDVEIFKKLEEDLKNCRSEAAVVDELVRATFGEVKENVRGFGGALTDILGAVASLALPGIGKVLLPKAKELAKNLIVGSAKMRELTKKKAAALAILKANNDMVDKAQSQIGDRAISDIKSRALEIAKSWKDTTRSDYKNDWDSLGRACSEVIEDKTARATEKAKILYDNMRPLYLEAISKSFTSIMTDPSSLASFNDQLDADTKKMFDDLAVEFNRLNQLRDNEPTKNAVTDMNQIRSEVEQALKDLKTAIAQSNLKS